MSRIKIPEEIPEKNRGSELNKDSPTNTEEAMHDTYLDEMAARLRINPATLQYWASRNLIPAIKDLRGRYLFDEGEVVRVVADWPPTPPRASAAG
jgi:hypothetical protein